MTSNEEALKGIKEANELGIESANDLNKKIEISHKLFRTNMESASPENKQALAEIYANSNKLMSLAKSGDINAIKEFGDKIMESHGRKNSK